MWPTSRAGRIRHLPPDNGQFVSGLTPIGPCGSVGIALKCEHPLRNRYFFLEQFTYCCGRYWLVGVMKLLLKNVLRGHKSACNAVTCYFNWISGEILLKGYVVDPCRHRLRSHSPWPGRSGIAVPTTELCLQPFSAGAKTASAGDSGSFVLEVWFLAV